jgi:hypothetical protein
MQRLSTLMWQPLDLGGRAFVLGNCSSRQSVHGRRTTEPVNSRAPPGCILSTAISSDFSSERAAAQVEARRTLEI